MLSAHSFTARHVYLALCTFMLAISTVIVTSSCVGADRGVDLSQWRQRRFTFSGLELVFRVPDGQSTSAPPGPIISQVDLERDLTRDSPTVRVFRHTWDYDGGWWKGVLGKLQMTVAVTQKPDDYQKNLSSLENLQEVIQHDLERFYNPRNEERREKGQTQFNVLLPKSYNQVKIGNRDCLVYSIGGFSDQTVYATPLTSSHYVTVNFGFFDNSRGYKTTWRQDAQVVAEKIAASLELLQGRGK
jgi:hypothetical protein